MGAVTPCLPNGSVRIHWAAGIAAKKSSIAVRPSARKKTRGNTLIGVFIGLVIGVGIAAGVVWTMNKSPLPFNKHVMAPPAVPEGSKTGNGKAPSTGGDAQPMALPGKPGDPTPEKRFQFYDILPGKADAVPDKAAKPEAKKEEAKKP